MFKPSRILVPTDMSDHSLKAIRMAFDIAAQYNAEVFLLHVIKNPVPECVIDYSISEELVKNLQTEMFESARKGILKLLDMFPSINADKIATDVRTGVPYEEILNEAEEREIDLIVISPLGTTGLAKYLMGSVARHVLLGAKCPVLLTK
ncbi:MAG: universal stress protein [Geobacteraceae bacterium]|nr:universal stress protein [Geobacteraceae bacterium]